MNFVIIIAGLILVAGCKETPQKVEAGNTPPPVEQELQKVEAAAPQTAPVDVAAPAQAQPAAASEKPACDCKCPEKKSKKSKK